MYKVDLYEDKKEISWVCPFCKKNKTLTELNTYEIACHKRYYRGASMMDIIRTFPRVPSVTFREVLISGICPECQKKGLV